MVVIGMDWDIHVKRDVCEEVCTDRSTEHAIDKIGVHSSERT